MRTIKTSHSDNCPYKNTDGRYIRWRLIYHKIPVVYERKHKVLGVRFSTVMIFLAPFRLCPFCRFITQRPEDAKRTKELFWETRRRYRKYPWLYVTAWVDYLFDLKDHAYCDGKGTVTRVDN